MAGRSAVDSSSYGECLPGARSMDRNRSWSADDKPSLVTNAIDVPHSICYSASDCSTFDIVAADRARVSVNRPQLPDWSEWYEITRLIIVTFSSAFTVQCEALCLSSSMRSMSQLYMNFRTASTMPGKYILALGA